MVGKTISHYEILEKLGAGGMGDIYKAQDTKLNRTVAVKVLAITNTEGTGRRRFIQEAQAASALNHPNIITIHDIVSEDDNEFMVMEYVAGKTLADLLPREGLSVRDTLRYGVQIADALGAAHAAGIIHRDLKPGNVMVTGPESGAPGRVKVLDFGLAKFTGRDSSAGLNDVTVTNVDAAPLTVKGSIIGTVSYMSPEQAQGKTVDHRSDIFSFGLVLYEMITGQRAFQSDSAISTLSAILRDEVRPIGETVHDVPTELEQIIGRALRKNPEERWQSMRELQAALEDLKQRSDSGTLRTSITPPVPAANVARAAKKPPMAALVAAAAIVLAAAGGGIWWKVHRARQAAASQSLLAPPAPQAIAETPAVVPPAPAPGADQPLADAVLTNQNVLDMVDAKISNALIINQIRSSKTKFNLSVPEVIRLSKAGVPDAVIEVMRNPTRASSAGGTPRPTGTAPVQPPPQNTAPAQTAAQSQPAAAPQPAAPAPPPPPAAEPVVPASHPVAVADGLPFIIRLMEDVPNGPQAGQALRFQATKDFRVGNSVVVAQGAAVTGEIVDAGKKKLLSKGPKPTFRLVQATAVDGSKLNLRATPSHHGDSKADRSLEVPGRASPKDLAAEAGTEYIAYTEGAQTVSVKQ